MVMVRLGNDIKTRVYNIIGEIQGEKSREQLVEEVDLAGRGRLDEHGREALISRASRDGAPRGSGQVRGGADEAWRG